MIDSLTAQGKTFALMDLGDFMSTEAAVGELKTRFIWKTMEQMGYVASTPGVRELMNWPLYSELLSGSSIRPVSSNLVVIENGVERPAGLEKMVVPVGGVRVGLLALIGGSEVASVQRPAGIDFRHLSPLEAAQRIVPELRKEAEVVVLMSELSSQETDDLLKQVPGIDVALYGRQPAWKDRAEKVFNSVTQQTGLRGQYVGQLVLIVDPEGRVVEWGSRNLPLDQTAFPEKAEVAAAVKQVEDKAKELQRQQQQQKARDLEGKISSDKFLGSEKCRRCHEPQYEQWLTTGHARAHATLATAGKQTEAECVSCHVTGWEKPGGYAADMKEPDLTNVQCESCHDVGTKHGRGELAAKITEETCTTCHTGEWGKAKGFDFASYLGKVTH